MFGVFFFKQKTAYERRISGWSSDVCSSDLAAQFGGIDGGARRREPAGLFRQPVEIEAAQVLVVDLLGKPHGFLPFRSSVIRILEGGWRAGKGLSHAHAL